MKERICPGSSILMIVLVISILVIFATALTCSTGFMMDVALKRLHKEQHNRALQGLLNYGVVLGSNYFDSLVSSASREKQNFAVVIQSLALEKGLPVRGIVQFKPAKSAIEVTAQLFQGQKEIGAGRCTLKRGGQNKDIGITNWAIGISLKNRKNYCGQ